MNGHLAACCCEPDKPECCTLFPFHAYRTEAAGTINGSIEMDVIYKYPSVRAITVQCGEVFEPQCRYLQQENEIVSLPYFQQASAAYTTNVEAGECKDDLSAASVECEEVTHSIFYPRTENIWGVVKTFGDCSGGIALPVRMACTTFRSIKTVRWNVDIGFAGGFEVKVALKAPGDSGSTNPTGWSGVGELLLGGGGAMGRQPLDAWPSVQGTVTSTTCDDFAASYVSRDGPFPLSLGTWRISNNGTRLRASLTLFELFTYDQLQILIDGVGGCCKYQGTGRYQYDAFVVLESDITGWGFCTRVPTLGGNLTKISV